MKFNDEYLHIVIGSMFFPDIEIQKFWTMTEAKIFVRNFLKTKKHKKEQGERTEYIKIIYQDMEVQVNYYE